MQIEQMWRVVDDGEVCDVSLEDIETYRQDAWDGDMSVRARTIVTNIAATSGWMVDEIVAPGELTRAEAIDAAVNAERARCVAVCRAVALGWQDDDDDGGLPAAAARMALSEAREFIDDGRAASAVPRTDGER